jgi:rare lipoprotein A
MTSHRQLILLLIVAALAIAPTTATAASGGATPGVITLPGDPPTVVRVGNPLLTARAGEMAIAVRASAHVRGRVRVGGSVPAGTSGRVRVERLDAARGWIAVATAAVAQDGAFRAVWRPRRAGAFQLRAVAEAASASQPDEPGGAGGAAPQLEIAVYERGVASWYGPGLWGVETACGVVLEPTTVGVAHRTLPCGTHVALYHRGRTLVAPVIDRGPFLAGRTWDLTLATFRGLGGGAEDGLLTLGALVGD